MNKIENVRQLDEIFNENTLVRYRSMFADTLKEERLYYSIPSYFNDPYDTLIYANYEKIIQDAKHNLEIGMDDYLYRLKNKNIPNALLKATIGYAVWNNPKRTETLTIFFNNIYEATEEIKDMLRKKCKNTLIFRVLSFNVNVVSLCG